MVKRFYFWCRKCQKRLPVQDEARLRPGCCRALLRRYRRPDRHNKYPTPARIIIPKIAAVPKLSLADWIAEERACPGSSEPSPLVLRM